jgi:uncharacterized protein (TIGR02118 family)
MIVLAVMYPNGPGKRFDMNYYCNKHMVLVKEMVGDALKGATVDRGLSGGEPGSSAEYAVITRLLFDSLEDQATYMAPHSPALNADIPNFTDITPFFQFSEVTI